MKSKLASWVVGLALGIAPITAQAQMGPMATPAARPQGTPENLTETQWLRQRVEQLQAALARGDNCAVKPGSNHKTGAAGKPGSKAAKSNGMGPMGMEPMNDKMGQGMKGKTPMDKMDPAPVPAPSEPPAPMPMEKEDDR